MALAIREQIFGEQAGIEYLAPDFVLSFDKRKGLKAQKTKEMHLAVIKKSKEDSNIIRPFVPKDFDAYVNPTSVIMQSNMVVTSGEDGIVNINVQCCSSDIRGSANRL